MMGGVAVRQWRQAMMCGETELMILLQKGNNHYTMCIFTFMTFNNYLSRPFFVPKRHDHYIHRPPPAVQNDMVKDYLLLHLQEQSQQRTIVNLSSAI